MENKQKSSNEVHSEPLQQCSVSRSAFMVEKFGKMMLSELEKNSHKGEIIDFVNFYEIITELEYHKAKLFLAIRLKNKGAIAEYLADTGNFLLAIGNLFNVFDDEIDNENCWEINKEVEIFINKNKNHQSLNQQIVS